MKFLLFFILASIACMATAQRRTTDSTLINRNALKTITPKSPTQQQTVPATTQTTSQSPTTITATGTINTSHSTIMQLPAQTTQTATTNTTPTPLPDMVVTNISFSPNTAQTYRVNYTLKNIGTTSVKKGLLSVQSYINGGAAGGANTTTLLYETNQLLNPGESINGSHTFSITGRTVNTPYTFELNANGNKINAGTLSEAWVGQKFTELNYANNTFQTTFIIPPPPPAPADVEVNITSITKSPVDTSLFIRIFYTLKNIGETAIPQNAVLTVQTTVEDTDNDPSTFLETACCGRPTGGSNLANNEIPYNPGEVKNLYFDARVAGGYYSSLARNVSYKFNVEIISSGFADGNTANNKNGFTYLLQ